MIKYRNPWELESLKKSKNIILVSLQFPEDSTGDLLAKRILETHSKDNDILILENLYARDQLFCIINTVDAVELDNVIKNNH